MTQDNASKPRLVTKKKRRDPLIGATIAGKYQIIDKLGEGGMGSVYRASQQPIERMVAVKVLLNKLVDDDMAVRRFDQEARAVSKMQHPNTVTIYDYGQTDDGRFYLVMEFLKGKTLTDLLRSRGTVEPHLACHVIRQVCASLGEAHLTGSIHRDLKPDNIFLTTVGNDENFVKVLDFGVAKLADNEAGATLTQTGMIFGTPKYMSPEQAEGRPIDSRADIYAIGVVLYELLTGRPPFLADTAVALLLKHISAPPPEFAKIRSDLNVPQQLEQVTMKALAKDVEKRYATVDQLADDLYQCMTSMRTGAMPVLGEATHQVSINSPVPTEMVPNQEFHSTNGLQSPHAVPDNLSLGVNANDAKTNEEPQVGAGATEKASVLSATTQQGQSAPAGFVEGRTQRAPVVETAQLSPSDELFLDAESRNKPKSNNLLLGSVGLLAIFAGVLVLVLAQPEKSVTTTEPISREKPEELVPAKDPEPDKPKPAETKVAKPKRESIKKPPLVKESAKPPTKSNRSKRPTKKQSVGAVNNKTEGTQISDPSANAREEKNKTVDISFSSQPAGAVVTLDGKQLGTTPFRSSFSKEITPVSFKFSLKGYRKFEETTTLARDRTVSVTLEKLPPSKTVKKTPKRKSVNKAPKVKPPAPSDRIDDVDPLNERVDELKDF
ncbi:MAG: protein kinase [Myxococcota bacterium]|nr:protein kinase [Myxococcota bacterium]